MALPALFLILQTAAISLANKSKSSITIAFVGPYAWIPGNLTYNESLIVSGYDTINLTLLQDYSQFGAWFYWNQLAATLAVDDINKNPNILPDTSIQIKRFNNFAPGSNENGKFASGGQAIATAIEIIQNHTDVVAVFGDFLAKTTIYDNAVFSYNKIPFCGATQTSMNLLNRNNYPYYFQTMTFAGIGKSIALMLNAWNVKRMAVISTGSLNPPSAFCGTVLNSVRSRGIQVVASLGLTNAKQIDHISQTLTAADARYILVCGSPTDVGKIYFGMAATGSHVGPGYTWIAQNIPAVNPATAIKLYGPDYYKNARGIITAWNGNDPDAKMVQLQTQLVNQVDAIQAPFGFQFLSGDAIGNLNMAQSYDCVGLLAAGISNLMLTRNSTSISADMKLAMNYTLFLNTGLNGLTGGPVILDELGEEAAGGQFAFVDGLTTDMNYVVFAFTDANSTKFTYSTTSGTMNDGTPLATAPVFFDGSSVPPADGPIYSSSMIAEGTSGRTLLLVLFSVGIILSVSFLIMIYYYRNHVAIMAGSIPFLTLMAIGAVPSYASTFTYFDTPTPFKCYSRKWLQLLSFVIICSCLILKNLRLAMIFSALAPLNPRTTSIYNWMWPIVFLVLIELVFLGMWTLYSRMTVATTVTGTQVNVVCVYGSNQGYKFGLGLWLYNIVLLLGLYYATYRSQVVRSSHTEFPLLVIVSIGLFFGALLLVSTQTADDIVNNELQHFVIIWLATSLPLCLQIGVRGLIILTSKPKKAVPVNETKASSFANVSARSASSLHGPATGGVPMTLGRSKSYTTLGKPRPKNFIMTFPTVYTYRGSNWQQSVVGIVILKKRAYVQFFPFENDRHTLPVAFLVEPGKIKADLLVTEHPELIVDCDECKLTFQSLKGEIEMLFANKNSATAFLSLLNHITL